LHSLVADDGHRPTSSRATPREGCSRTSAIRRSQTVKARDPQGFGGSNPSASAHPTCDGAEQENRVPPGAPGWGCRLPLAFLLFSSGRPIPRRPARDLVSPVFLRRGGRCGQRPVSRRPHEPPQPCALGAGDGRPDPRARGGCGMTELCEVVITAPDPDWLRRFTRELVDRRLGSSVHNFSPVQSYASRTCPGQCRVRQGPPPVPSSGHRCPTDCQLCQSNS
jgi:hypothetical protein